ncbi:NLI interacting factor-like phosphatase-domain-containing protein [Spinellus fusiger]|nr:NLI interacting factor-like phosphatase-domain-containing protein [Spinellus fusiger]
MPVTSLHSFFHCRFLLFLSHSIGYFSTIYQYIWSLFIHRLRPESFKVHPTKHTKQTKTPCLYYKKKTLVLDLDETLVHSVRLGSAADNHSLMSSSIQCKNIEVKTNQQDILYIVYKRPHLDFFLHTISQWYKVIIFTASLADYANPVIDWLNQDQPIISQRYFRQSCEYRNGHFVKDISLAEPDLSKVCLVDNSASAFALNQENGIPLKDWISNPQDECLLDLLPLLDALRFTTDVRSVLRLRTGLE